MGQTHVGFMVTKVALGHVLLSVLRVSPIRLIPRQCYTLILMQSYRRGKWAKPGNLLIEVVLFWKNTSFFVLQIIR
jgi:hypothetical protein